MELNVKGLVNIQFAVKDGEIYVIEVNPRASRSIPFVSKTMDVPLAKLAARVMAGKSLKELGFLKEKTVSHIAVKESVFPFNKFADVDVLLGPEMKSTGEVMGIDSTFGLAFAKSQLATGICLPPQGTVFISVKEQDRPAALKVAKAFEEMGYDVLGTPETMDYIRDNGLHGLAIKTTENGFAGMVEVIESNKVQFIINTVFGEEAIKESFSLRRASLNHNLPYCTTMAGAFALVAALQSLKVNNLQICSIQEYGKGNIN